MNWVREPHIRIATDLDHGLEYLETAALGCPVRGLAETTAPFAPDPHDEFDPERLRRFVQRCSFAKGETVIRQGDVSDDMFILRSGTLSIWVDGPGGERIRLRIAGPGTIVGEIAFILRRPRTAWAVTDTAVTADRITRAGLARMAAEVPSFSWPCRPCCCEPWLGVAGIHSCRPPLFRGTVKMASLRYMTRIKYTPAMAERAGAGTPA